MCKYVVNAYYALALRIIGEVSSNLNLVKVKKFRIAVGIEMVKIPAINPPCLSFLWVLLRIGPIKVNQKWPFSG